jgi:serine/threonine-protein kinase HipA
MAAGDVDEAVSQLRQHPLGVDEEVRVSLGGLQSKLLLVQAGDGWARPVAGFPSTHILKPDPPEFPGLVASEAFAQQASRLAGLETADSWLDTFGGRTVIVVKRFDREMRDGKLTRVHQEDGCQALGVDPTGLGKYQALDGAASYRRLAGILASNAADPAGELRKLAAMVTFTLAIGNADAHLRNHALLHSGETVRLSPIFDASPAAEFAGTRQLALWIDGQSLLGVVTRGHLIREFASWGWGPGPDGAGELIGATLTKLMAAYPDAMRLVPEVSPAIVEACQQRTARLLRQA